MEQEVRSRRGGQAAQLGQARRAGQEKRGGGVIAEQPGAAELRVFKFVEAAIRKDGKPPRRKDIAEEFGVSQSRIQAIMQELDRLGYLEVDGQTSWVTLPGYKLKATKS